MDVQIVDIKEESSTPSSSTATPDVTPATVSIQTSTTTGTLSQITTNPLQKRIARKRVFGPYDRRLLMQLLYKHPMVFLKSSTRDAIEQKNRSWNVIFQEFVAKSKMQNITVKQLRKLYNNMGNPSFEQVQASVHEIRQNFINRNVTGRPFQPQIPKGMNSNILPATAAMNFMAGKSSFGGKTVFRNSQPLKRPRLSSPTLSTETTITEVVGNSTKKRSLGGTSKPLEAIRSDNSKFDLSTGITATTIQELLNLKSNEGNTSRRASADTTPGLLNNQSNTKQKPNDVQETSTSSGGCCRGSCTEEATKSMINNEFASREHELKMKYLNRQIECLNQEHEAKMSLIQMQTKLMKRRMLDMTDILNDTL